VSPSGAPGAPSIDDRPPLSRGVLVALCGAKLLLHLATSVVRYGYFRDELYYLDMARHLDWGLRGRGAATCARSGGTATSGRFGDLQAFRLRS